MTNRMNYEKYRRRPEAVDPEWHTVGTIGRKYKRPSKKQLTLIKKLQKELSLEEDITYVESSKYASKLIQDLITKKKKKEKVLLKLRDIKASK